MVRPDGGSGLLEFFPEGRVPRPEQAKAITQIEGHYRNGKDIVLYQGPPGTGKTFTGMTFATELSDVFGLKTHIITSQVALQKQYLRDFKPHEIELVMGRDHYPCVYPGYEKASALNGYCRKVLGVGLIQECLTFGTPKEARVLGLPLEAHLCPYYFQATLAQANPIILFNTSSFLFQQRLNRFGSRHFMILDECHNLEAEIMAFANVTLDDRSLRKVGVQLDRRIHTNMDALHWIEHTDVVARLVERLKGTAFTEDSVEGVEPEEADELRSVLAKIENFRRYCEVTDWAVTLSSRLDSENNEYTHLLMEPLFVKAYGMEFLFSKAKKTLAMSATVLDPSMWAENLGLDRDRIGFVESPCVFPVENRPIHREYVGKLWANSLDRQLSGICAAVRRIMDRHKGQRGIIHTHTDSFCRKIVEAIGSPRLIHLDMFPKRDKELALMAHEKRPDSVIVASGMHEGIDLHDDLARFQIIAKLPRPPMDNVRIAMRNALDPSYSEYLTAVKLVQSYGRPVRHKDDWAYTYLIDMAFDDFAEKNARFLPKWFTDALKWGPPKSVRQD